MLQDVLGFTAALTAAAHSGLLAALLDGPARTATEHASARALEPRATALVLDVLVAYGIAARDGERVTASPDLVALMNNTPGGGSRALAMWAHVPEFLRTGAPFMKMDGAREELYAGVVGALGRMFAPAAATLAKKLPRAPRRVLDIGCGSGVWGLAIAQHHLATHVTGLDLPAVLEAFRGRAAELGVSDRTATLPGDVHAVAIPRAFDLVVIANVLRIEAPDRARAIVHRAVQALEPGGQLLVVDALAAGTPEREQARSVYALHLGMRTDHGRVYSPAQIADWFRDEGLREIASIDLDDSLGALGALLAS